MEKYVFPETQVNLRCKQGCQAATQISGSSSNI